MNRLWGMCLIVGGYWVCGVWEQMQVIFFNQLRYRLRNRLLQLLNWFVRGLPASLSRCWFNLLILTDTIYDMFSFPIVRPMLLAVPLASSEHRKSQLVTLSFRLEPQQRRPARDARTRAAPWWVVSEGQRPEEDRNIRSAPWTSTTTDNTTVELFG